jgi:hypothetical protein
MNKFFCRLIQNTFVILIAATTTLAQINFLEHTIDDNTHGTGGIYACDLDGDNDMDVLAASLEDNEIVWWRNDGGDPIEWTKFTIGANVYSAHSVIAKDIDGDETLDVVGAAYYGSPGIAWWRNNGGNPLNWTKYTVAADFSNAHEIYAHDLDKDNDIDILGASSDLNKIAWWRNDGGNPVTWTEQTISNNVTLAKSVHVGDFDDDNDFDIVGVAITTHNVFWWRNDGGQPIEWTQFLIDGNFIGAHRVQAVDLDNDSDIDVLGAGYLGHQVAWWRNNGGDPIVWSKQLIGANFTNACVAYAIDFDSDGDSDVVATAQGINQIAWWRQDSLVNNVIHWTKFVITNNFVRPWPLYACDLDGDGNNDIISGSSHDGSNEVKWWKNDGIVGVEDDPGSPAGYELMYNYPNPFNPNTRINFSIPQREYVRLQVFDVLGSEVAILVNEEKPAGIFEVEFNAQSLPSGIYFYRLSTGDFANTKKMILLK